MKKCLLIICIITFSVTVLLSQEKRLLVFDPLSENRDFLDTLSILYGDSVDYSAQLPGNLSQYDAVVFFPGGDFNTAHRIDNTEGDILYDYLLDGGILSVSAIETQAIDTVDFWKDIGIYGIMGLTIVTRVDSIEGTDTAFANGVLFRDSFFNPSVPFLNGNYKDVLYAHGTPFGFASAFESRSDSFKVVADFFDYLKRSDFLEKFLDHYGLIDVSNVQGGDLIVSGFELFQNYPNPFNPSTVIKFNIPDVETGHAPSLRTRLSVYDILGGEAALLLNEFRAPGTYEIEFDGGDLPSGVYIYRLQYGQFDKSMKMILLK